MSGAAGASPAFTPVSSIVTSVGASVLVSNRIRSAPGTKRQPVPVTIGAVGNIGGTAIQPSASGVMFKPPPPGLLTNTGMVSVNGGTAIGRLKEPRFVGSIWAAVTGCQPATGVPVAF